jgi:hypothetical protein
MDVIINEVVSSVKLVDTAPPDPRQLQAIVRTVMAAIEERDVKRQRQAEETRIADDGRGGLGRAGVY